MKYLLLLLFLSTSAFARVNYVAPIAIGATLAASAVGSHEAIYRALIQHELKNWSRPETGTSVRLENQCGVNAEFHLAGNSRDNFLLLGIANTLPNEVVIKNSDIKFVYDNKRDRFPGFRNDVSDSKISSGWWQVTWIPFPSKDEFKKVDHIKVEVPVWDAATRETCIISTSFERTGHNHVEDQSYSAVELMLDGGFPIGQYGDIKELGGPSSILAFEINFYLNAHHGVGVVFSNEYDFDGSDNPKIINEFDERRNYSAGISFIGAQYVYRHFFTQNLYFTYGPGIGVQFIEDLKENDRNNRESSTTFAFSEKLMLNWRFYQFQAANYQMMDFVTGFGVIHHWAPSVEVNGQDLSGNRLNFLFRVGFGF
ncbi:hypothetical protein [Peredibacter starrii]|uniref:Outer membrane protein beta-barrel domain-containing protein n=1 Tax=Peredibacter starrii TaxID=28202 RepID=A0AAX4HSS3_9BACT|nr:hypothetical protein [Peredibacter starrii]WPU66233.1 hypothetical protein SOO65_05690 [Peredibacter starrii]